MMGRFAGGLDVWLSRWVVEPRFVSRHPVERAAALAATQRALPVLTESDWLSPPPPLELTTTTEGHFRRHPVRLITWDVPALGASRRLGVEVRTTSARAMCFTSAPTAGNDRRPVWILIHGWLGGTLARDLRDWPAEAMLEKYDLVHVVLPGHGRRRVPKKQLWPSFPTRNPFANALGLATAAAELRQLVDWLRRCGYQRIGIAATSIGAHIAALCATLNVEVERLLLDRPLVRMSEPWRRVAARLGGQYGGLVTELEAVYAPVDPLLRPLTLPSERVDFLLGRHDAIASAAAGQHMAEQWGVLPHWFEGAHVLQTGRRKRLWALLSRL